MSYYVEQIKDDIHITAENWQRFQRESSVSRPTRVDEFWFHERPIPYSGDYEISNLSYCRAEWDEDCEQWLECLAPYVVDGSELAFWGEDSEIWGYRFESGKLNRTKGMFVMAPQTVDIQALKQALTAGELTVEQISQLLDMLDQME